MQVADSMGREGLPVLTAARQALVDAWAGSMWVGAGIALAAAALVVILSLGQKGREDMAAQGVLGDEPAISSDGADGVRSDDVTGPESTPAGVGAAAGNGGNRAGAPEEHVLVSAGEPTVRL